MYKFYNVNLILNHGCLSASAIESLLSELMLNSFLIKSMASAETLELSLGSKQRGGCGPPLWYFFRSSL
jgi:hypothetical protein